MLCKVQRQSDSMFIQNLKLIQEGSFTQSTIDWFNEKCYRTYSPTDSDIYVFLNNYDCEVKNSEFANKMIAENANLNYAKIKSTDSIKIIF